MRADGSDPHPLLPGRNDPQAQGNWTPDGEYYVFSSWRNWPVEESNIWSMRDQPNLWNKSTPELIQLTNGPLRFFWSLPARDSKKLFAVGLQARAELVRYDARSREFVPYLGGISAGEADFSRDVQWVAYVSYPDHTLWRSKVDGRERLQLTYAPIAAELPHGSPDGRQIAFMGLAPGKDYKIFLISRGGGQVHGITTDQFMEGDPTWSPDGALRNAWKVLLHPDCTQIRNAGRVRRF